MDTAEIHRPKRCNKENKHKDTGLTESMSCLTNSNANIYVLIYFNAGLKVSIDLNWEQGK